LFDSKHNLVDLAYDQISASAKQEVGEVTKQPHDRLYRELVVSHPGYAYIYVSNESPTLVEVYFDDLTLTHRKSPVVQWDDYYPFGMGINSNSYQNSTLQKNDFLYNGKERQDELGIGWLDYGARMYMAEIGRWGVVDPLAEKFAIESPYSYVGGDPISRLDPDGQAWRATKDENTDKATGYEWIGEEDSYDESGNLHAGLYEQAIFFADNLTFDEESDYNMGSSTAYVYKSDGTIARYRASTLPSDLEDYPTVPEGQYEAKVGTHNGSSTSYTALRIGDVGTSDFTQNQIELGYENPAFSDGRTYATGINIHKAGLENKTGMTTTGSPISAGCLLMDVNTWDSFIGNFDTDDQRNNVIGVTLSRSTNSPINMNIPNLMTSHNKQDATRLSRPILPLR
jgi:RHS repeat-associated protein